MQKRLAEIFRRVMNMSLEERIRLHREFVQSEKWCPRCGVVVDVVERHCRNCGKLNDHFDPAIFEDIFEMSLDEAVRTCYTPQEHADPELTDNYCMNCGTVLPKKETEKPENDPAVQ